MFSFGAKTSATTPATGTLFGSTTQASTPQFGFGSNLQQPSASFGATTSTAGTAFGQSTGLAFPATPASTSLGTGGSFSFGVPGAAATTTGAPGLSLLGSANKPLLGATSTPVTGFGATPASAASTGFTLGGTSTGTSIAPTTFSAGGTSAPSTGFNLGGTSTPSTGFNLGGTSTAPTAFSLGGTSTALSSAAPTFSFNTPASGTTTAPGQLNFGVSTAGSTGLNFNLGSSTTGGSTFNFGTSTSTAPSTSSVQTTATNVGLGGLASTITTPKTDATGNTTAQKETNPREQQLPNEIFQTVESFKQHIKQQKMFSSDIARYSVKDFERVRHDIDTFNKIVVGLERELQMNRCLAEKLKYDTAKSLQHIEMAQRTHETPPGLQHENNAPTQYFNDLVDNFEKEMHALKHQIESTDKYIRNFGQPASLTSQDLAVGMKRLHETFVALAGRLQSVHSQVESQKELYLNIRKQLLNDNTNLFENQDTTVVVVPKINSYVPPKVASGPTPFNNMVVSSITLTNLQSNPPPAYPSAGGTSIGGFGTSTLGLGLTQPAPQLGSTSLMTPSNSFQLQKPPTGNKRGKQ